MATGVQPVLCMVPTMHQELGASRGKIRNEARTELFVSLFANFDLQSLGLPPPSTEEGRPEGLWGHASCQVSLGSGSS